MENLILSPWSFEWLSEYGVDLTPYKHFVDMKILYLEQAVGQDPLTVILRKCS